jgi:tetratricopeptide (TPR) repeat protein
MDITLPGNMDQQVADNLHDFAVHMRGQRRFETALVAARRATKLAPNDDKVWGNLGSVYWNLGRLDEALEATDRAVQLNPNNPDWLGNLGIIYGTLRRYDNAQSCFDKAASVSDNVIKQAGSRWDNALLLLERGEWIKGFEDYEARIEVRGRALYPEYPMPYWKGESLDGKTIFIQPEQGIGDIILFSRFLAEMRKRWPTVRVKMGLNHNVTPLLWEFNGFVDFLPGGVPIPDTDYCAYMGSLPYLLGITTDTLTPDPGLIKSRCQQVHMNLPQPYGDAVKVGIAWTGNPEQDRNHERTIPLELLITLAENPKVFLYSFQVGHGDNDLRRLGLDSEHLLCNLGPHLEKEGLVAAGNAMLQMDLMITVCTSTAHLAGALGVPTWALLCHDPYWVWMQDSKPSSKSLFYPSVTMYSQEAPRDWAGVMARVRADLDNLTGA